MNAENKIKTAFDSVGASESKELPGVACLLDA